MSNQALFRFNELKCVTSLLPSTTLFWKRPFYSIKGLLCPDLCPCVTKKGNCRNFLFQLSTLLSFHQFCNLYSKFGDVFCIFWSILIFCQCVMHTLFSRFKKYTTNKTIWYSKILSSYNGTQKCQDDCCFSCEMPIFSWKWHWVKVPPCPWASGST